MVADPHPEHSSTNGCVEVPEDLVLEPYGDGYAWFRPSTDAAEADDARWWPTQAGRELCARWRAERWLFGREVTA